MVALIIIPVINKKINLKNKNKKKLICKLVIIQINLEKVKYY